MSIESIIICLEQKNIFMSNIINITKQLEVKAKQDEVNFEDLLVKRQECMNRVDKCDQAIKTYLNAFDTKEKEMIQDALNDIQVEGMSQSQQALIHQHKARYKELLQHAVILDGATTELIKERHSELRDKVNNSRKQPSNNNLYNIK